MRLNLQKFNKISKESSVGLQVPDGSKVTLLCIYLTLSVEEVLLVRIVRLFAKQNAENAHSA